MRNMPIKVIDNYLYINDQVLDTHTIIDTLGAGANGIVYLAFNKLLQRKEALKVWIQQRNHDRRDKQRQGLLEAMKQAANNGKHSVQIYHVDILNGVVYASMEYIDGITLKEYCEKTSNASDLVQMAYIYLSILEEITTKQTLHGDPHWKNVLIYTEQISKYKKRTRMKLCDFGTSEFTSKESSKERHWRIVEETVINMTKNLESYLFAKTNYEIFKKQSESTIKLVEDTHAEVFDGYDIGRIRTAALRDYLDGFTVEVMKNRKILK